MGVLYQAMVRNIRTFLGPGFVFRISEHFTILDDKSSTIPFELGRRALTLPYSVGMCCAQVCTCVGWCLTWGRHRTCLTRILREVVAVCMRSYNSCQACCGCVHSKQCISCCTTFGENVHGTRKR